MTAASDPADQIIKAIDDSIDNCARCKVCDTQDAAVRAAVASALAERDAEIAQLKARVLTLETNSSEWGHQQQDRADYLDGALTDERRRREQAEATIARVRALARQWRGGRGPAPDFAAEVEASLAQPGDQDGDRT